MAAIGGPFGMLILMFVLIGSRFSMLGMALFICPKFDYQSCALKGMDAGADMHARVCSSLFHSAS